MAVSVLTSGVSAGLPFAQQYVARIDAILRVAPFAGVGLCGQTAIELRQAVLKELEVGLGNLGVAAKHINGALCVGEKVEHELLGVCHTIFLRGTMLRRIFLWTNVGVVGCVEHQTVEPELGCAEHGGEGTLQEIAVEGVAVVLPEVCAIPCVGNDIVVGE